MVDSPPLTAVTGQTYSYTFAASGTPAPSYALTAGAPSWLSVNASTGLLTGAPPTGTTSFTYTVTAANTAGTATAGPFTVTITTTTSADAALSAALACPATMTVGGHLHADHRQRRACQRGKVVGAVLLLASLSEVSCTPGCARHGNVLPWTLASLASGASAKFTVTLKASKTRTALVLGVTASQNPNPHPLKAVAIQAISIKQ